MYLHGNEELSWHTELFNYQGALRAANIKTVSAFLGQIFIFGAMWLSQKWSPGLELVIYIRGVSSLTPISIDSSKQIGNLNVRHHDAVSAVKAKCPLQGCGLPLRGIVNEVIPHLQSSKHVRAAVCLSDIQRVFWRHEEVGIWWKFASMLAASKHSCYTVTSCYQGQGQFPPSYAPCQSYRKGGTTDPGPREGSLRKRGQMPGSSGSNLQLWVG